jgi:calcineurin-like phosphoesterase family protein
MDETHAELERRWNVVVPPDGVVYHLGDASFRRNSETLALLKRLNGSKHLIEKKGCLPSLRIPRGFRTGLCA